MESWKEKKLQTVDDVTFAASLTAIRIRLFGKVTSIITTNQRCEVRSYRMCGSLVPLERTVAKKLSVVAFRKPSATPVALLYDRIRPLTTAMNCVGPAAPIESGGK